MTMEKVSIIGSGNVGANTAFFIAEKGITNVFLYDVVDGLSTGKALDMMEAAPMRGYRNRISGIGDIADIAGSETVIIAVGAGCSLGTKREDLLTLNWPVVSDVMEQIRKSSPNSIVVVATEPVDLLVTMIARNFPIPRERLIGLGGILDATRLKSAVARELSVSPDDVAAMVIGRHSSDMVVLPEYTRVSGIPVDRLLSAEKIDALKAEIAGAGALMAELAECPGTYYTPSAAAAEVVDAIHMDLKRILSISTVLNGEYGICGAALSLPCVIGKNGVEKVLEPVLNGAERDALDRSVAAIKEIVSTCTE
ncbi:MAG: malate dehydrogenase [Spirochaetes bacterium]|nr:MAG: malate dehydrogenase [Spirochaetota bacterium]